MNQIMVWLIIAAVAVETCAVVASLVVPLAVGALGFGTAGITAGSWAAWFMATYGGVVAAGSVCAILQSIGATGIAAGPWALWFMAVYGVAVATGSVCAILQSVGVTGVLKTFGGTVASALRRLGGGSCSLLNTLGKITASAFSRLRGASLSALNKLKRISSTAVSKVVGILRSFF